LCFGRIPIGEEKMLRDEVEALLKIEGLELTMELCKSHWGKDVWRASIGFNLPIPSKEAFTMCSAYGVTNHGAASKAYRKHLNYKNHANN
jgi:hypothetical protein